MGRLQRHVYHVEPSRFPPDFPERLERLRRETGLSRRAMARALRVEARTLRRWRSGTQPGPGHLYRLFRFAAGRGLLHCLLPDAAEPARSDDGAGALARGGGS
ncbi:MAG: helix-turn-helix transcriptional regulator [Chloroflexi bacterium]|nr:helix-turn-helix transcriptional regulator [Chloroflexota bacterium]